MKAINTTLHPILIALILTFIGAGPLAGQQFRWATTLEADDFTQCKAIAVDAGGNVYTTGQFQGSVDLDPGPGTQSASTPFMPNMFIIKQDSLGNLVWAKTWYSPRNIRGEQIEVTATGDIYVGGVFRDSVDFDPGGGVHLEVSYSNMDLFLLKLDANGDFLWVRTVGGDIQQRVGDLKVDYLGNVLFCGEFWGSGDIDPGPAVQMYTSNTDPDFAVWKFTPAGSLTWVRVLSAPSGQEPGKMAIDSIGNIYIVNDFSDYMDMDPGPGTDTIFTNGLPDYDGFVTKWDPNGNMLWWQRWEGLGRTFTKGIALDHHGYLYASGVFYDTLDINPGAGVQTHISQSVEDAFVVKMDTSGHFVWGNVLSGGLDVRARELLVDNNLDIYFLGEFNYTVDFDPGPGTFTLNGTGVYSQHVFKWDSSGNFIWAHMLSSTNYVWPNEMVFGPDYDLHFAGWYGGTADVAPGNFVYPLTAPQGSFYDGFTARWSQTTLTNLVQGQVYWDENLNCQFDSTELPLPNSLVRIDPQGLYASTDSNGYYSFPTDTGTFTLTANQWAPIWSVVCPTNPTSHTVQFSNRNDTIRNQDFGQDGPYCPYMTVNVGTWAVTPGRRTTYYVNYCNMGTQTADSVWISFEASPLFTVDSSSMAWQTPQNGLIYDFYLGTVPMGQCGTIKVFTTIDTTVLMGQAVCVKAHIHPDTSCYPTDTLWDRASVAASGSCVANGDSVRFIISNVGTQNMSGAGGLVVLQDDVLTRQGDFELDAGLDTTFAFKTDGSTWVLKAEQRPAHPGNSNPTVVIEACGVNNSGGFSTGYVVNTAMDEGDHFIDINCREATAAYDPNDKRGFPRGISASHFIETNQGIEYLIRFQNTGNDTAYRVVIRDTLDTQTMDIRTFQMGATSHPYTFRIYGNGIAEWTFDNIMLPDSNVNEPESHGFVQFHMDQQLNNPVGTLIENSADIYFDYNLPILTNTSWHTIGGMLEEFVVIDLREDIPEGRDREQQVNVEVYPNPFTEYFTVRVEGVFFGEMELTLFDLTGRTVKKSSVIRGNQVTVFREGLHKGAYLYRLAGDGELLSTGKLILR